MSYITPKTTRGVQEQDVWAAADAVLLQEKRRTDWIVGQTGKRLIRWGATELRSVNDFSRWLVQMRIPTPPRSASRRGELLV